jgi:triosephosphate isomerase
MHGTRAEAALAGALAKSVGGRGSRGPIAPPFTAIDAARDAIAGARILLGGQNVHGEDKGAFTG